MVWGGSEEGTPPYFEEGRGGSDRWLGGSEEGSVETLIQNNHFVKIIIFLKSYIWIWVKNKYLKKNEKKNDISESGGLKRDREGLKKSKEGWGSH